MPTNPRVAATSAAGDPDDAINRAAQQGQAAEDAAHAIGPGTEVSAPRDDLESKEPVTEQAGRPEPSVHMEPLAHPQIANGSLGATQVEGAEAPSSIGRPMLRFDLGDYICVDPLPNPPRSVVQDGSLTAQQIIEQAELMVAGLERPTVDDIQAVMIDAIVSGAGALERDPILALLTDAADACNVGRQSLISTWSALIKQRDAELRADGGGAGKHRRTVWRPDAEPADEHVTTEEVFAAIREVIGTYIHAPPHTITLCAMLCLTTYVVPVLDTVPYARISSPMRRCGKSTLLMLMASMSRRALVTGNVSPAAIYRVVDGSEATLLIDEIDRLRQSEAWPAIGGLVNAGNTRETSGVVRSAGDDHDPHIYQTFGLKIFAGIGVVEDTLADRCIDLHLERRPPSVERTKLRMREQTEAFATVRAKLERWAADIGRPRVPSSLDIARERLEALADRVRCENDRLIDITEPLLAIAVTAGEGSAMLEEVMQAVSNLMQRDADTQDGGDELLTDIARILAGWRAEVAAGRLLPAGVGVVHRSQVSTKVDGSFVATKAGALRITTAALTAALVGLDETRWPTFSRGRPLTPHALKGMLKGFRIEERRIRVAGQAAVRIVFRPKAGAPLVPKGFISEDLDRAIGLYAKPDQSDADDAEGEGVA